MFRFEQYVSGEILKLVLILAQFRLAKRLIYIYIHFVEIQILSWTNYWIRGEVSNVMVVKRRCTTCF